MDLVNLGELSKPATVLVEKVSDAIGGVFRPFQIRRIAEAEADADRIRAVSQIEITELKQRAMYRFIAEEAKKQQNIESIVAKALPQVDERAHPDTVEDDWITNFFDKCRLISDGEMQALWARILAGEANGPGRFSKRTINALGSLDKSDAGLFSKLLLFVWTVGMRPIPLVYEINCDIYGSSGLNFPALKHLNEIGLISLQTTGSFAQEYLPQKAGVAYCGKKFVLTFPPAQKYSLPIGHVVFSKTGEELASICTAEPVIGFVEYVVEHWKRMRIEVSER